MMNNYGWTLIIWWKRKIFIYFVKCYWIKKIFYLLWSKTKNVQLCFMRTKLTACMSTTWSAVLYLICLFFSFFMQNWLLWYTCKYLFQHFLSIICFFKKLEELSDVFRIFFKRYFFINNIQSFYEEKIKLFNPIHFVSFTWQTIH